MWRVVQHGEHHAVCRCMSKLKAWECMKGNPGRTSASQARPTFSTSQWSCARGSLVASLCRPIRGVPADELALRALRAGPASWRPLQQRPCAVVRAQPRRAARSLMQTCAAGRRSSSRPPKEERLELSKFAKSRPLTQLLMPPADCDTAWLRSQRAWVNHAIQEPVAVSGMSGGTAWSGSVHVLGIHHESPINPRMIGEVADAIQPDAVALEQEEDERNRLRKAAQSTYLLPLLGRVMSTPITGLRHAYHEILTLAERTQWEKGLASERIALQSGGLYHYVMGDLGCSECLAAAYIARKWSASWVMIDTHLDGRNTIFEVAGTGALRTSLQEELSGLEDPLLQASFQRWFDGPSVRGLLLNGAAADPEGEILEKTLKIIVQSCVLPNRHAARWQLRPGVDKLASALEERDRAMRDRIVDLCSGKLTGKPRKRVLAIVGRSHVAPLEALLRGN